MNKTSCTYGERPTVPDSDSNTNATNVTTLTMKLNAEFCDWTPKNTGAFLARAVMFSGISSGNLKVDGVYAGSVVVKMALDVQNSTQE